MMMMTPPLIFHMTKGLPDFHVEFTFTTHFTQCVSFVQILCTLFPVCGVFLLQRYSATCRPGMVATVFWIMDEDISTNASVL